MLQRSCPHLLSGKFLFVPRTAAEWVIIMKIFYFSGSGNSLWAAKQISAELGGECLSVPVLSDSGELRVEDTVVGFAFPVHMLDVPWAVKPFLLRLHLPENAYTFAVLTYNNRGVAECCASIEHALAVNSAHLSAGFGLRMPGNCIASTAEEDRERLTLAPERVREICASIRSRVVNCAPDGAQAGDDYVTGSYFYSPANALKNLKVNERCTGCGICATVCPMGNIRVKNGKVFRGENCAVCLACVHWCPTNAVYIDQDRFRELRQYRHPDVTLAELIEQSRPLTDGGREA